MSHHYERGQSIVLVKKQLTILTSFKQVLNVLLHFESTDRYPGWFAITLFGKVIRKILECVFQLLHRILYKKCISNKSGIRFLSNRTQSVSFFKGKFSLQESVKNIKKLNVTKDVAVTLIKKTPTLQFSFEFWYIFRITFF